MQSRDVVDAALDPGVGTGARDLNAFARAIRQRIGATPEADPRAVALELGKKLLAVTDRRTLRPGVLAELRGDCILYRWTEDRWRESLWIGIGLALAQKWPGVKKCPMRSIGYVIAT
jgi:hypothetical protein